MESFSSAKNSSIGFRYGKWVADTLLDVRVKVNLFDPIIVMK